MRNFLSITYNITWSPPRLSPRSASAVVHLHILIGSPKRNISVYRFIGPEWGINHNILVNTLPKMYERMPLELSQIYAATTV